MVTKQTILKQTKLDALDLTVGDIRLALYGAIVDKALARYHQRYPRAADAPFNEHDIWFCEQVYKNAMNFVDRIHFKKGEDHV